MKKLSTVPAMLIANILLLKAMSAKLLRTKHLPLKILTGNIHLGIILFMASQLCAAPPIKLASKDIAIEVDPANGGRITAISGGGVTFAAPAKANDGALGEALGFGKVRIFGDSGEYMSASWKIEKQDTHSITLSITQQDPPQYFLEIIKKISLPAKGRFVKIETTFRNNNPVAANFAIVPWIHHGLVPLPGKGNHALYIGHAKGISRMNIDARINSQNALKHTGNWTAYMDHGNKRGLIAVTDTPVEVLYNYGAGQIASLELLYPVTKVLPETKIITMLAPVNSLDQSEIDSLQIPQKLIPQPNAGKDIPGERVNILSHFRSSTENNLPLNFKFWKSQAYIAPEIALPLVFGVRKTASGGENILEIDVPDFVKIEGNTGNYWWMTQEDMDLKSSKEIIRNGQKYTRLRYQVTARPMPQWSNSHYTVFARSTQKNGNADIYYRGIFNGKETMNSRIPCEVISIPQTNIPQKFKLWFGIPYSMYKTLPEFNKTMRHLGINGICFNYNIPNKVVSGEQVRQANETLKKDGFTTAVMGAGFLAVPREAPYNAIDIDGKDVPVFDFTVREGNWIKDRVAKIAEHMNYGYDIVISDEEAYFGGHRYSFTGRTREAFRKYCAAKYPETPFIDALTVAENPEKYPEQDKIWLDFKCKEFGDIIDFMISSSRKAAPNGAKIGWCTVIGASDEAIKIDNLIDNSRWSEFLDYTMPMAYHNLYRRMSSYRNEIDLFHTAAKNKRAIVAPTLTLGFWGEGNTFPAEHNGFIVLETALTGCHGAYIFPGFAGSDNLGVKHMSKALDIISKCENIIYGAMRKDHLITISGAKNMRLNLPVAIQPLAIVNGNKMLVYFAEYSPDTINAKVKFQLPAQCNMRSLTRNIKMATVNDGDVVDFTLTPGWGKVELLLLERTDGKDFPKNFGQKSAAADAKKPTHANAIFYDSFEGNTAGKKGSNAHSFVFADNGQKGKCLMFRDYQANWILDRNFKISSGEAMIDFQYKFPKVFHPGVGKNPYDLIRGHLDDKRFFTLFFDGVSGKLTFAINEQGKSWTVMLRSQTDRWPENIWQNISLTIGKSGVKVMVNNQVEIASSAPIPLTSISNIQLGRQWCSFGAFDELYVFDNAKVNYK